MSILMRIATDTSTLFGDNLNTAGFFLNNFTVTDIDDELGVIIIFSITNTDNNKVYKVIYLVNNFKDTSELLLMLMKLVYRLISDTEIEEIAQFNVEKNLFYQKLDVVRIRQILYTSFYFHNIGDYIRSQLLLEKSIPEN